MRSLIGRIRGIVQALGVALLFWAAPAAAQAADKRVALVIGNAAYVSLPTLVNSVNDSVAMRDTLRAAGFETFYGADLKRIDIEALTQRFFRASEGADIAVIYYAGHGVQVAGDNFIVPVDAKLATPYDIEQQTVKVADIFNVLSRRTRAQIIFLDACRNNPFKIDRFWIGDTLKAAGASAGLARTNTGLGSLIAFSTEPGAVAFDGTGATSPYTTALIRHVAAPNEEIRKALTLVRREVIASTDGKQVPWENSSLVDDVFLTRAPPAPVVQALARVSAPEGGGATPLRLPPIRRTSDDVLQVTIDQPPDQGALLRDGKPFDSAKPMTMADFEKLAFDPAGLAKGSIAMMGYSVSDRWGQKAHGVVAVTIEAAGTADAAGKARIALTQTAAQAALGWLAGLDKAERRVAVGVGPVALGLPKPAAAPPPDTPDVIMVRAPERGVLKLGERTLGPRERFGLGEAEKLAYLPPVGGEGQTETIAFRLEGAEDSLVGIAIKAELDGCDRAAASPLDLQGVGPGKLPNEIDAAIAIPACESAVRAYPGAARFKYQLGRALLAARRNDEAREAIAAAAEAGHARATWELGNLAAFGAFDAPDAAKGNGFYRQCAEGGDAFCLLAYGRDLFYGRGDKIDVPKGLSLMLRAAELGHTYAMNELGYVFVYGKGVPKDVERGLRFYEAGAERDDIYSLNNLGLVYLRGAGRPADATKALAYFTRAADGGHPYAPTNLGRMARDGVGGPKDLAGAAKWLELAAERGDYWGALDRGRLSKDAAEAARYFALASTLNTPGDNFDPQGQAAQLLAQLPATEKARALAKLLAESGESAPEAGLDERLTGVQGRIWRKRNPRFDLF